MAYTHPGLVRMSAHANSNFPTLWGYKSADTVATVNTAGYFNAAAADLKVGDVIMATLDTGGTPQVYFLHVDANDGTTVDVRDGLAVGTTDTD